MIVYGPDSGVGGRKISHWGPYNASETLHLILPSLFFYLKKTTVTCRYILLARLTSKVHARGFMVLVFQMCKEGNNMYLLIFVTQE